MRVCVCVCVCMCVLFILAEKVNHLRSNVSKSHRLLRPSYDQSNKTDRNGQLLRIPGHRVIQNSR